MFRDLNRILSQNNRSGRKTTNVTGMNTNNIQYANKYGNNIKNPIQNGFQIPNLTRKRKWQQEPDRLPLRMIVTPLVWRDNAKKGNDIDQTRENSYGNYQRETDSENPFSPCQEKKGKISDESFISHSQRILARVREKQLQHSLKRKHDIHAQESHTETVNKAISGRTANNNSEVFTQNSPIQPSEIEHVLQTPMQSSNLPSPHGQTPFNSTCRSSNILSDSDESPSVPNKNTIFCENIFTDLKRRRDNRPISVELGSDCESLCDDLVTNFSSNNNSLNSEGQFHWNPVVINSPAGDMDKQIDWELCCMLQDRENLIENEIEQELNYRQVGSNFEKNYYHNNAMCFNDFTESNDSVLYNDSASSANSSHSSSNHSSSNAVKNCFQQCEEFWSRRGQICLKTTFEVTDVTNVFLKNVSEEDFYCYQDSD